MALSEGLPFETHWQDLAGEYDPVMGEDPSMRALRDLVVEAVPESAERVLDVGTGTGILIQLLRRHRPRARLVGLDPAPAMLDEAHAKLGGDQMASLMIGSADELTLPSESFDAVVSNFALHHLEHSQKRLCAREVHRVLRPGGRFVFGDQYCLSMGVPDDTGWVREMLELFSAKARYYLDTAGLARMLLQVRLMPRLLTADGEIPCTVGFWLECLELAGFEEIEVRVVEPAFLQHRVVIARKALDGG